MLCLSQDRFFHKLIDSYFLLIIRICADTAVWLIVGFVCLTNFVSYLSYSFFWFADKGKFLSDFKSHRAVRTALQRLIAVGVHTRTPFPANQPTNCTAKISADSNGELAQALPTTAAVASTVRKLVRLTQIFHFLRKISLNFSTLFRLFLSLILRSVLAYFLANFTLFCYNKVYCFIVYYYIHFAFCPP